VRFDLGKKMQRMRARFRGERESFSGGSALCGASEVDEQPLHPHASRDRPAGNRKLVFAAQHLRGRNTPTTRYAIVANNATAARRTLVFLC